MNKGKAQRAHAKQRFGERHLMAVSNRDLDAMVVMIRAGKAKLVERQSLRVAVYDLTYEGRDLRVVYDRKRKTIVTTLFPEP